MSAPAALTMPEWMRDQTKRMERLERRGRTSDLGLLGSYRTALLDPLYRGPGPARVSFVDSPTPLSTDAYQWLVPYIPNGTRIVNMLRMNGTWVIAGQTGDSRLGGPERLPLSGTWLAYNESTSEPWWNIPRSTRLSSGIVVLSGLLRGGSVSVGSLLATLPEGHRPDHDLIHHINNGDTAKAIEIRANGQIVARPGGWISNYVSLEGISFPAAGVAQWTEIGAPGSGSAFVGTWKDHGQPQWGKARFWKDPYGYVWMAGLVNGGSTADNSAIFTLPAGHRPWRYQHFRTTSADAYGGIAATAGVVVGGAPINSVVVKANTSNVWISLAGPVIITQEARDSSPWYEPVLVNGWAAYDTASGFWPRPAVVRRPDGLCLATGMIGGGTVGAVRAFSLRDELWPAKRGILDGMGNNARARFDISPMNESVDAQAPGAFSIVQGSSSWTTLDSISWLAG